MFLPKKIIQCRKEKKISSETLVKELSKHGLDVSRQTIGNWETGLTTPNCKQLAEIAMYFGKPITYFFILKHNRKQK